MLCTFLTRAFSAGSIASNPTMPVLNCDMLEDKKKIHDCRKKRCVHFCYLDNTLCMCIVGAGVTTANSKCTVNEVEKPCCYSCIVESFSSTRHNVILK